MADSKFANIFQNAKTGSPGPPPQEPPQPRREKPAAHVPRPLGRPPGKRSDPAWKQYSVLLKKETQREAANILRAKEEGQDLSGLVQTLLAGWVKRQKP
jgi:hypothetical protein